MSAGGPAPLPPADAARAYKRTMIAITAMILVLALAQGAFALQAGSRQLLKDAADWGYDVALYGIAALVFGRGAKSERAAALAVAAILAAAGLHTLYDLWDKIANPRPIEAAAIGFSAASAIAVGVVVLLALLRFRADPNPLVRATWLTARNDAIATFGYALLSLATRLAPLRGPEYALDLLGAGLCAQASLAIVLSTVRDRRERGEEAPQPARSG